MNSLNFNQLPDRVTSVEPGPQILTIIKAEAIIAKTGSHMLQLSYKVGETNVKINFDNCVIQNANGEPVQFGLVKLKKIMVAIGYTPEGNFNLKTLIPQLVNKKILADVEYDKSGKYLQLGSIESIKPVSELNQEVTPNTIMNQIEKEQAIDNVVNSSIIEDKDF